MIHVDLATSYQSRPHLDENTLKSPTFLKNAFLHVREYLKNWRVKFGEMLSIRQIRQSLAPPKFRSIRYYMHN